MLGKKGKQNAKYRVGRSLLIAATVIWLATGCWDRRELDTLAIVMGAGVDLTEQEGRIELVAQIVEPGSVRKSESGGSGGQATVVIKSIGSNVADADSNANNDLSRHLYWAHTEVLIISEAMARQGISPIMDFFYRNNEPRERMKLLICRGKPEEILTAKGVFGAVSALSLADVIGPYRRTSTTVSIDMHDFLGYQLSPSAAAYIPIVQRDDDRFAITATAVFAGDQMVGELSPQETRGLLWVTEEIKGGTLVVGSGAEAISVGITRVSSRVATRVSGELPRIGVTIYVMGDLRWQVTTSDLSTPEIISIWEKAASEAIRTEVLMAIEKAQQLNADIFRFGEYLHRAHPSEWRTMEKNWDALFPRLPVEITVQFTLEQTGMITKRIAPLSP